MPWQQCWSRRGCSKWRKDTWRASTIGHVRSVRYRPRDYYYGHSLVVHRFPWHDTSVIFVSCQLEFGTKERRPSHEMLFKGRTYPFANQQLACLNIILAGQFWSSQPLSLYLKNKHANHQVHLCSFEFCCSFNSCSTYFGECMRTSNASFHLWWWLGV